jgi:hypothetical protein
MCWAQDFLNSVFVFILYRFAINKMESDYFLMHSGNAENPMENIIHHLFAGVEKSVVGISLYFQVKCLSYCDCSIILCFIVV